jgi:plastocyanin
MGRRPWIALVAAVALAACGGEPAAPPARTPTPLDHATTGAISGSVRFEGDAPAPTEIRFGSFGECSSQHQGPVTAGDVLVKDGKVAGAFVYLKAGLGDRVFAIPTEPVEIDQVGCLYQPRVTGAQVGQLVRFANGDPLLHNVHGTPTASPGWNMSLSRKGAVRDIRIDKPEVMVSVRCDLHPWMQAWIGVVDHPYFAVTGPDGAFLLKDVPPGDYTVAAWHERFGTREARVTLAPAGTATATFTFTASK